MGDARIRRIVSGGQTGVDRAALDAALAHHLPYAGWCPRGGWAEDLADPPGLLALYPELRATATADPTERTRRNIRDSDVTLVVRRPGVVSAGTDLTLRIARLLDRPALEAHDAAGVIAWLESLPSGLVLNVAGPRASEDPTAYDGARRLLDDVLRRAAGRA